MSLSRQHLRSWSVLEQERPLSFLFSGTGNFYIEQSETEWLDPMLRELLTLPPPASLGKDGVKGKILGSTFSMCYSSASVLWTKHSTVQKQKCGVFLRIPFQVYVDGEGNIWRIKAVPIHEKTPCLVIRAKGKTASVPGGPGFRPLLVLHGLLPPSPASISPGCFGASWEVETILIRLRAADTLWHKETRTPVSRGRVCATDNQTFFHWLVGRSMASSRPLQPAAPSP